MELSDAKIFIESLKAYNEGKSVGKWMDLSDYSSGEEVMEAISDFLKEASKEEGELHEEYAIHDFEGFPKEYYSESMGEDAFDKIYELFELADETDIPVDVIQQYIDDGYDIDNLQDNYHGSYKDAEDFAYETVQELGLESFSYPHNYVFVTDTDRRLIAQEEANNYADEVLNDDEAIKEADMDSDKSDLEDKISDLESEIDELNEAEEPDEDEISSKESEKEKLEEEIEGMADKAREKVREDKYDEIHDALDDPYQYFVEDSGMYSAEDFFKANFVSIDYEKIAKDLEQDYNFIEGEDGSLYVFRTYAKGGKVVSGKTAKANTDDIYYVITGNHKI